MYILKTVASFDSAHFLAGYNGKCSNLHGHDFRPTAENMAKYFYEKIRILGYNMKAVTVYETPVNSATYME